ncbi:MATE family efflux transporter [Desmospora activa]|uniref:Probable multidrug resistance protein NorM n=1 Tax=Desmospora activa DSM 45169 TaxID=1121389 RepID=A0A2T4ZBE1_9BACL|nr:MATE family efflux transporter [Desmospora activa]PTM59203.1 MATE family multidrug resistance protein [Desmospora activa DSM 45169]
MQATTTIKGKWKQFLTVLTPMLITQVGLFAMKFIDTIMAGNAGASDLAGVAIATSLWLPFYTGIAGILMSITPIVSQLVGANRQKEIPSTVFQGIYLAVIIALVILGVGVLVADPVLSLMQLEEEVYRVAKGYLIALAFGIVPLFLYNVLRYFIDALGQTRISMFIILVALPFNALFNYVFIFGQWGMPRLGGIGAGVATALTYWFIAAIALFIVIRWQPFSAFAIFQQRPRISLAHWKEMLTIGVPVGCAIFFETSIFAVVTLFMSAFDTITIAAHQAAINFASWMYMVPMGIGTALTILVGFEVGANRLQDAKQYSIMGIGTAVAFSLLSAVLLWVFRAEAAALYSTEQAVRTMTQQFLLYAIFFQLSDALVTPIQGVLRGYKDVNWTLFLTLISFWVFGIPVGILLANYTAFGPFGYWMGLISGLGVGAIGLWARLILVQRKYSNQAGHEQPSTCRSQNVL